MSHHEALRLRFEWLQSRALAIGGIGMLLLIMGALTSVQQFYQSYLFGFLFWMLFALGCLGVLLLHHLVSGAWGHVIQRMAESGARTLPYMAVLFIPLLFGLQNLFPWSRPEVIETSHVLHKKVAYLNVPFFIVRGVAFFVFWSTVAFLLSNWSRTQDQTGDPRLTHRIRMISGPALVLFVLTATLAGVDWMMSLEPDWYSTIYGMHFIVGAALSTFALCIIGIRYLSDHKPFSDILTTRHYHHLGNLLFAFTILWAYMSFSQYLIIWSGNQIDDNFWYIRRLSPGWQSVAVLLLVGHFFVPFFVLLSRKTKRVLRNLSLIAIWILVMRLVDLFWLIMPAFNDHQFQIHWLNIVAPIGIGGIWVAIFVWQLKGQSLLPLHDPRFNEKAEHINTH
jgi:hypothetical protein